MTPNERIKLDELKRGGFHPDTCFGYVDSTEVAGSPNIDTGYKIIVFVEPGGNIAKAGKSFDEILDWWLTVFKTQPKNADYISAGWWLFDLFEDGKLPDDPTKVWYGLGEQLEHEYTVLLRCALREIAEVFKHAKRNGADKDEPEGTRYIQIGDTLANRTAKEIEELIEMGNDAKSNRFPKRMIEESRNGSPFCLFNVQN